MGIRKYRLLPFWWANKDVGFVSAAHTVVPIADLRGAEGTKYSKEERVLRTKLAALYRLVDLFQWSQGIYNHITVSTYAQRFEPPLQHATSVSVTIVSELGTFSNQSIWFAVPRNNG